MKVTVLSKESKLVTLEKVLERYPGEYEKESVTRVRDLVAYVEENSVPKDKIPYNELDFPDFDLYFQLVPQWRYKPKEFMRNDEKYGGKYFFRALKQKCISELGFDDYRAELAMDSLLRDCNKGIVTSNMKKIRPVEAQWALGEVQKMIREMKKKQKP